MKKIVYLSIIFGIIGCVLCGINIKTSAYTYENKGQDIEDDPYKGLLNYDEIQEVIDEVGLKNDIRFEDEVNKAVKDGNVNYREYIDGVSNEVKEMVRNKKDIIVKILAITIVTAIFTNFANVMGNAYVSQTGFLIVYLVLVTLIINSFMEVYKIAFNALNILKGFMQVIVPVYTTASFMANGIKTATVFNQLTVIIIMIIEIGFLKIILPLINIYLIVHVINNINTVNALNSLGGFIKMLINFGMKAVIIVITSMGTIQRLIAPSVDLGTKKILSNGLKLTPFVGKSAEVVNDTISSAMLMVKNAIGGVSMIVVIIMCLMPLLNILVYVFLYEIVAIIVEAIADTRVVGAIKAVGESSKMLLQVVMGSAFLFIITIALLTI